MIAVLAREEEYAVIGEFFELFKTPWQRYSANSTFDVLICSNDRFCNSSARLVLVFGIRQQTFDQKNGIKVRSERSNRILVYKGDRIPIYGTSFAFENSRGHDLVDENTGEAIAVEFVSAEQVIVRIGFDLFAEIENLLTRGQPMTHASIPTLELHIAMLRDIILSYAIPLVEIPSAPAGHKLIVCLTHDVDHAGIRNHRFDHTFFGFVYRATIGSVIDLLKGKRHLRQVLQNWKTVISLPLVYLRIVPDFWANFSRYLVIEKQLPSTFFVIPRKGDPGANGGSRRRYRRAAAYELSEIRDEIQKIKSSGCEVGLHGIDAWVEPAKAIEEAKLVGAATGETVKGVRMHWLYFSEETPLVLQEAGMIYDSTLGYNETIGYRNGTTQVFRLPGVEQTVELPMHVMDTAMFYPDHMNLSPERAERLLDQLIQNCVRFGGVLTINWHDRSIAPERLWDGFYRTLLDKLRAAGAWFATAADCVDWFKKRRLIRFEDISSLDQGALTELLAMPTNTPPLKLRKLGGNSVDKPFYNSLRLAPDQQEREMSETLPAQAVSANR